MRNNDDKPIERDDRELKRITPFSLHIDIQCMPVKQFSGYQVNTTGVAQFGDRRLIVPTFPKLAFFTAQWHYSLSFDVGIEASAIVPIVNKANKD